MSRIGSSVLLRDVIKIINKFEKELPDLPEGTITSEMEKELNARGVKVERFSGGERVVFPKGCKPLFGASEMHWFVSDKEAIQLNIYRRETMEMSGFDQNTCGITRFEVILVPLLGEEGEIIARNIKEQ
jgi:hypothetical protein